MSVRSRHPRKGSLLNLRDESWVRRYWPKLLRTMYPTGYVLVRYTYTTRVLANPHSRRFRRRKR